MSHPDALNPYPEIQPRLFEAWNEGFRVGSDASSENPQNHMPEELYSDTLRYVAWREGFRKAQST